MFFLPDSSDNSNFVCEMPNRTVGSRTEWCALINKDDYLLAIMRPEWRQVPIKDKLDIQLLRECLSVHIGKINALHNRFNGLFNLIGSSSDPLKFDDAIPRTSIGFLSKEKNPSVEETHLLVSTTDLAFSHIENLVTGEGTVVPSKHLWLVPHKTVGPMVANYLTGVLAIMDRFQYLLRETQRYEEKL